ncbi:MAG: uroporphyrinogen decarboxylase [Deltaproteobacteria bacterium]|nr:uroporphyrinogen decarboxylase [Deltaproteobacteria bacterium]
MSQTASAEPEHLFLRACRRLPVPRTPIWMMRQAGRYLPEYRAVRAKASFLELCRTPELACEVTLQPIDLLGFDAAILFSDILITLPAMGLEVAFPDKGPKILAPVRDRAGIDAIVVPDPEAELPFVMEAVRQIQRGLGGRVPLIGFAGAPFTMMTYAVEGGGSKDYAHTRKLLFGDPGAAHALLDKLARTTAVYLEAQIAAGADAVQLFDSWAGILSPRDFREFALRWSKRVIELIRESRTFAARPVPIIYFVNGCAPYLEDYATSGADVLGVDWRVDIDVARRGVGDGVALQGNLDPGALFLSPRDLRDRVAEVLAKAGPVGHIFNLGHGVLPETDPEHVRAMITAVRELSTRAGA